MERDEFISIAQNEGKHWWYRSLHRLTWLYMQRNGKGKDARILDAACGTGGMMQYLREKGCQRVEGFDQSDFAVQLARERNLPANTGDLRQLKQAAGGKQFDVVICHDALYFLNAAEQRRFLHDCAGLLFPGGVVLMNIPALAIFSGPHDGVVNIKHRVNREEIKRMIDPELFELSACRYWPFLLSPMILFIRWINRLRVSGNATAKPASDLKEEAAWLNVLLRVLTAFEIRFIPWTPFGSSLFVVLKCK